MWKFMEYFSHSSGDETEITIFKIRDQHSEMTNALFMSPRLNYSTDQDEWTNIFSQIFSCFQWSDLKNSKKLRDCSFFMKCENSHFFKIMKIDTAAFHRGRTKWSPKELRKPTTWPNSWTISQISQNFWLHTRCTNKFF